MKKGSCLQPYLQYNSNNDGPLRTHAMRCVRTAFCEYSLTLPRTLSHPSPSSEASWFNERLAGCEVMVRTIFSLFLLILQSHPEYNLL